MAKCKNCKHLGYLFDGDEVGERVWCGNIADSPVLDMERDCEYYVPQTNADRIRSMTDEELAGLLKEVKEDYQWANPDYPDCEDCGEWLNWLQLEAE